MNDYQKFLRQRKILIAAIIFCVAIIVFGSGYIVLKLDPEFSILPGIPEIIVDHGDEIGGTTKPEPDDETEPHTEPTDPDNTSEPATPETPSTPETPATPETPSTPVTPPTLRPLRRPRRLRQLHRPSRTTNRPKPRSTTFIDN